MSTLLLITGVVTVSNSITLPPVGDALLAGALEHPLVAVSGGKVGLGQHRDLDGSLVLTFVMFVAAVKAVVFSITFPVVEDAVTVLALELPIFTLLMFCTILEKDFKFYYTQRK